MAMVMAIPFHLDHCVLPYEAGEVNLGDLLLENRGELRKVHVRDLRLSQVLGKNMRTFHNDVDDHHDHDHHDHHDHDHHSDHFHDDEDYDLQDHAGEPEDVWQFPGRGG